MRLIDSNGIGGISQYAAAHAFMLGQKDRTDHDFAGGPLLHTQTATGNDCKIA